MFRFSTIFTCAALACSVAPASAQSRVEVGALECRGGASTSFIVGSVTELSCVFRASAGGTDRYQAVVRHVGLDLGFTEQSSVIWAVFAPSKVIGGGDLAGNYGGVQAGASVGVGVGANVLVGGSNNSFTLQPVSVQAQTGLSVAAGIASLELRYVR
ncbi:MAG: hypothetical protein QOJ96_839 [Alphaproteobacteria bacterium]|jgi:hypothetical protein|nr:hypothetical protein [Alphaproteobacteria bacterium]